jgi:hypothetical protein
MLSRDFVVLVLISCAVAVPLAWYYMSDWLKTYQYKTSMGIGIFAFVVVISIAITLITVSFQSIKAAIANPVKSLRTE